MIVEVRTKDEIDGKIADLNRVIERQEMTPDEHGRDSYEKGVRDGINWILDVVDGKRSASGETDQLL